MEKIKNIIKFKEEIEVENNLPAIVADMSFSEDNNIDSAHTPPTTPKHQPTKTASTNAPERIPILTINTPKFQQTCQGCIEEQSNQMAHTNPGGCLEDAFNLVADDNSLGRASPKDIPDNKCPLGEVSPRGNDLYETSYKCPCYVDECPGDCGTLWCGCIDVCRGRCGIRQYEHGMWH